MKTKSIILTKARRNVVSILAKGCIVASDVILIFTSQQVPSALEFFKLTCIYYL